MENFSDILKVQGVKSKGYGIIGKLVMLDRRLTIEAKAIYAYFCSYAGAGSTAFPSVSKIIEDLEISENRFYKHFKLLKNYGYILVEQVKKGSGKFSHNLYTLTECPEEKVEEKVSPLENDIDNDNEELAPSLQNDDTVKKIPSLQNRGTGKIPYLKNEGTGQKAFPSLSFPCTENVGTNINRSSLKLTDIYNNLSFYLSNTDKLSKEERDKLKKLLNEKDGKTDGENHNKIIQKYEFETILEKAEVHQSQDSVAAEQALRLLYFNDAPLKINNLCVSPEQVREDLKNKININSIKTGFNDFLTQSNNQQIKNPIAYLSKCIYNAMWHAQLKTQLKTKINEPVTADVSTVEKNNTAPHRTKFHLPQSRFTQYTNEDLETMLLNNQKKKRQES